MSSHYRFLGDGGTGYYHVVSRVVDRRLVLGDREKAMFRRLMEGLLGFTGLECVTYCLMGNHFHLLLRVPDGTPFLEAVTDEALLRRVSCVYGGESFERIRSTLARLRKGRPEAADAYRRRFTRRMYSLSVFMQELKSRFTRWYNGEHHREGTLWEGRFRSTIVEPDDGSFDPEEHPALLMVAAYIDLNPLRAGLVDDPLEYRWCGYAEAAAGNEKARRGLRRATGTDERSAWNRVQADYRTFMFGQEKALHCVDGSKIREVLARGGKLSLPELLRCRIRYFTDGKALGRAGFVEALFERFRRCFSDGRRNGARRLRCGDFGDLHVLRDLRKDNVTPPGRQPVT